MTTTNALTNTLASAPQNFFEANQKLDPFNLNGQPNLEDFFDNIVDDMPTTNDTTDNTTNSANDIPSPYPSFNKDYDTDLYPEYKNEKETQTTAESINANPTIPEDPFEMLDLINLIDPDDEDEDDENYDPTETTMRWLDEMTKKVQVKMVETLCRPAEQQKAKDYGFINQAILAIDRFTRLTHNRLKLQTAQEKLKAQRTKQSHHPIPTNKNRRSKSNPSSASARLCRSQGKASSTNSNDHLPESNPSQCPGNANLLIGNESSRPQPYSQITNQPPSAPSSPQPPIRPTGPICPVKSSSVQPTIPVTPTPTTPDNAPAFPGNPQTPKNKAA